MPPPTRQGASVDQVLDHGGVAAAAERGVEIDDRDLADPAEALGERARIAGVERLGLAADQLDRLAGLEIDRGDDHGRTGTPCGGERPLDVGDA